MNFKKNKFLFLLICILIAFALYSFAWFVMVSVRYNKYTKIIPKNELGFHYFVDNNRDSYYVKKPSFPTFTGNLVFSTDYIENPNEDVILPTIELLVWPEFFKNDYKYGIVINNENIHSEIVIIDKHCIALDPSKQYLIDDNIDEINRKMNLSNLFFK